MREWGSVEMVPNESKLAELVLYVAERLRGDPKGGATKINKVLFFAEFAHMRLHGVPITGVEYQKLEQGPAPRRLLPVRDGLVSEGAAELVRDRYLGYPLDRLVPRRKANLALFGPEELKQVDQAIEALWSKTAAEVSELSHHEMGWQLVSVGETIPYEAAFLASHFEVTESMRQHARRLATQLER